LGIGEDYVYHGTTNFQGLHEKDILQLSAKQKEVFFKENVANIFPEFFLSRSISSTTLPKACQMSGFVP